MTSSSCLEGPPVTVEIARSAHRKANRSVDIKALERTKLTKIVEDLEKACGGKLSQYPSVGMSDEFFRNCTTLARFGSVIQVVATEEDKFPLRLYVFPSQRASRVYSVVASSRRSRHMERPCQRPRQANP
jgi:hypothetical protein